MLVTVGPLAAAMLDAFDGEGQAVADAGEAASILPELLQAGDTVLVKGLAGSAWRPSPRRWPARRAGGGLA